MGTDTLSQNCEKSFFKELYQLSEDGQAIFIEESTQKIYLQKKADIYSLPVYQYLMEHPYPHIPKIRALWQDNGILTIMEEFIQGSTLEQCLQCGSLTEDRKKSILLDLCDTLNFLHSVDPAIIHRDIKASNVMITEDGITKLIDFNAAKFYDVKKSKDTVLIGTEGFAAPEQYGFRQLDARTDIYALGVLIGEMFPYDSGMQKIAKKATQMDPDERYENIQKMRRQIAVQCGGHDENIRRENFPVRKGIIAAVFAVLVFYFAITLSVNTPSTVVLWINRICFFLMGISLIALFLNGPYFFPFFHLLREKRLALRIIGYILASAAILLFWVFLAALTEIF